METNTHNQSYWFVNQGNVIFSTNSVPVLQGPHISAAPETRYVAGLSGEPRPFTAVVPAHEPEQTIPPATLDAQDAKRRRTHDDDTFWDRNKVKLLLTMCLENKNVAKNALWNEISYILGSTPEECNKRYWHLRRTYLRLLKKKRLGKEVKWVHYGICEQVFRDLKGLPPCVMEPWDDEKTRKLLNLYIENLQKYQNPSRISKDVWKDIAAQLESTSYHCYHKFKNLRRSYMNWMRHNRESGKPVQWPYCSYFERINFHTQSANSTWDRNKVKILVDSYSALAHKFRNPKLSKKELWKEISHNVGESPSMCDKKFRNLKQTYTRLKSRTGNGRVNTKWRFYKDFESIYSNTTRYIDIDGTPKIMYKWKEQEDYVKELLTFYIDNKDKFRDPLVKKKNLWKIIAPKLSLTPDECDKKFRNLKQTYIRLSWKKKQSGKQSKWAYFPYFEEIFREPIKRDSTHKPGLDDIMMQEIRCAVEEAHEARDRERKFERLVRAIQESNDIQRERNRILLALLKTNNKI